MDERTQNKALRYSLIDGAFSSIADAVAGGIFLTGFALKVLHASAHQIGILAALPMFANLAQLLGSYIIEKKGERKMFCLFTVFIGRLLWVIIVMLPLAIFAPIADWRVWVLVAVIAMSDIFQALSGVAWLAWMSDVVPEKIRGTFFGKRNMVTAACGIVVVLMGGKFVTMWSDRFSESNPYSFIIIFATGIIAGSIAAWFLLRIPDIERPKYDTPQGISFSLFLKPLKDRNFLIMMIFVSVWTFAVQFAAPFYAVFMMQDLKISLSTIAVFTTFSTLATLFMMKIWGPISDKLGNKPVMIVSGWFLIGVPFIWILVLPKEYYVPALTAHILTGAFTAGAALSQSNILIKLSPQQGRSTYLAMYACITGLVGGAAPIAGGCLSTVLHGIKLDFFGYDITNFHIIFILSAILQACTIFFILKVKEPEAATPVAVIMQLKNDLNPQTGLGSATDFIMVEVKRGGSVLKQFDDFTDSLARRSEARIKRVLDIVERIIGAPVKKIIKFFRSED